MAWKITDEEMNCETIYPKNGVFLCDQDLQSQLFKNDLIQNSSFQILKKLNNECWKIFEKIKHSSLEEFKNELDSYKNSIRDDASLEVLNNLIIITEQALIEKTNLVLTGD